MENGGRVAAGRASKAGYPDGVRQFRVDPAPNSISADQFFAKYPTGFTVVDVASLGVLSVTLAQEFAALGPDLRGKKIVLSIMPGSFFINKKNFIENNPDHDFAMNFSPLRTYETIFSPYLSFGIKNEISSSMLIYRDTIRSDPFLYVCAHHHVQHFDTQSNFVLSHLAVRRTSNGNPAIAGSFRGGALYLDASP